MFFQSDIRDPKAKIAKPRPISRRQFFKRMAAYAAVPAMVGIYSCEIEPFWPQFHELVIPIPGLPASFENYRIAQLTDLHTGRAPFHYLKRVIARVKAMKPDLVAVTGDLTHHNSSWVGGVAEMLGSFNVPVIVSYGNHDFGVYRGNDDTADEHLPEQLAAGLEKNGCQVLRNRSTTIDHPDGRLWYVGLDDLWFGQFDAHLAFTGVPTNEPVIALSHNPDTAERLDRYRPNLILAGHTHGGQVRIPFFGAIYLNITNRRLDQGQFQLKHSTLYVCRGIGYINQIRFYCRPEVPIFRLVRG